MPKACLNSPICSRVSRGRPYPRAEYRLPRSTHACATSPVHARIRYGICGNCPRRLPPLFLIDAGAAEALAIAYLAAFATIAATIAFAVFAELPLVVALIAKVRAVWNNEGQCDWWINVNPGARVDDALDELRSIAGLERRAINLQRILPP